MKKIIMGTVVGAFSLVGTLTFFADDAEAIPVFARKYGMSCNSCHTMFPKLSKMGVAFRERGFRFAEGKDDFDMQNGPGKNIEADENAIVASNFPFTVRTQVVLSGSGPITDNPAAGAATTPVMPGHRFGMVDGGLTQKANGDMQSNYKIGFGELGLISSGSYDNWFWWLDANTAGGIGMLEGGYYVSDLLKIRFGRVQNNVGYGMTMMSQRPLGFGQVDAAQMAGATMLMMGDGISIHGTTDGDTGVGTYYNFSAFTYGANQAGALKNLRSTAYYGRVAQELMGNHIIGVYGYKGTNWGSDLMGGEASMLMAMIRMGTAVTPTATSTATAMAFTDVTRYGIDFAFNYGEPMQVWGAYTVGVNKSVAGQNLKVKAATLVGEFIVTEGIMIGAKYDYTQVDLQMMTAKVLRPLASSNTSVYGIYQVAENVQGFVTYTQSSNLVTNMGANMVMGMGMVTQATQKSFNTAILGVDLAF